MLVGRIGRPHGLHGHLVVQSESDNPDRFRAGSALVTESGEEIVVERSQERAGSLLVRFEGVSDRTAAELLTGTLLYVDATERRSLDEGEFWPDELVGLKVRSVSGADLGTVEEMIEGSAQYRMAVRGPDGRFEVPFVLELVPEVDTVAGVVVVADVPGLVPGT